MFQTFLTNLVIANLYLNDTSLNLSSSCNSEIASSIYFALIIHLPVIPQIGVQVNRVKFFPLPGSNTVVSESSVL
jgi:hypothetical protein